MVKLTFRIPSKAIQYGYVEMEVDLPDDPTPEDVATQYLDAVSRFQVTEMDIIKGKQGEAAAKLDGAEADAKASAHQAVAPLPDDSDEVTDAAAATLAEGLGGVTVVEDEEAPWNKAPAESTVAEVPAWDNPPSFDWS